MTDTIVDLGYRPRAWQAECHRRRARFTVLALHRRAGKTEFAVLEMLDHGLQCGLERPHYGYVAPFLKQAKAIAWDRLKHYARKVPGTSVNESELWVRFKHNGAKLQVFGADNADAMRGLRLDGVVMDEFAMMRPEAWTEVVQPALADRMGWALFIGTPHGVDAFSDLFYRAADLPDWYSARYTCWDTGALDPGEVERLQRDMPEQEFAREMLCDFSASSENQLLSLLEVEESANRLDLKADDYRFAPKVLGVDVARFGDDRSVIMLRQGLVAFEPKVFRGMDNMAFAAHVAQEIVAHNPDAVFIDIGNGSGVVDRLRQLGHDVIEVNFGGKATDPVYVNKRTEMWMLAREWVRAGGRIPNRTSLKQDLASPTFSYNASNQVKLESKDELKKRLTRSPDEGDALVLTFAFPVAPRSPYGAVPGAKAHRCVTEDDDA